MSAPQQEYASGNPARDGGLTAVLVNLARVLGTDFSSQEALDELVDRTMRLLAVGGAGLDLVREDGDLQPVSATPGLARQVTAVRRGVDGGPWCQAWRTGKPAAVPDLRVDEEFPAVSALAAAEGVAAMFSFPLRLDGRRQGALTLYRDSPGSLAEGEAQAAQVLADVASAYLLTARLRDDATGDPEPAPGALFDPLTGLPAGELFADILAGALARAERVRRRVAVLLVAVSGLPPAGTTSREDVGNRIRAAVLLRLCQWVRSADTLARLPGDTFAVVREGLTDRSTMDGLAEQVRSALAQPFVVDGRQLVVACAVEVTWPGPPPSVDSPGPLGS